MTYELKEIKVKEAIDIILILPETEIINSIFGTISVVVSQLKLL